MGKLKDQLAGVAALIAAIIAIGGGFVKYGEVMTKLDSLSSASAPDLSGIENNSFSINDNMQAITQNKANLEKEVSILQKEIKLLNLQLEEIKAQSSNPLGG
jgi:predicted  nucleic acid-binding Zn-ribbon protein|tara:strand:- start:193 stop:498 length:306 start_codon:yes stop_codon:yes gene_type:complete